MSDFNRSEDHAVPQMPPGWYPSEPGWQQYWDGSQWTEHRSPLAVAGPGVAPGHLAAIPATSDETGIAVLAHLGGLIGSFLLPLIIYLIKKDESPFLRHHAAEALNFQITLMIAFTVSFFLIFLLVGIILLPLLMVASLVLTIVAAMAANRGEWYKYPMILRLIT